MEKTLIIYYDEMELAFYFRVFEGDFRALNQLVVGSSDDTLCGHAGTFVGLLGKFGPTRSWPKEPPTTEYNYIACVTSII